MFTHDRFSPFRSKNKDRIGAVILENTFTSIPDIAKILFPFKFIKMLPGMIQVHRLTHIFKSEAFLHIVSSYICP